jgi:hypothetical protein
MNFLERKIGAYPIGTWLAILALFLQLLAWAAQVYSLVDWDGAVDAGLQTDRFTGDDAERARAKLDWGIVAADMVWPLPITIVALAGLFSKRMFGHLAGFMELSIGVYWPVVFAFQRWPTMKETILISIVVWSMTAAVGLVGLWATRPLLSTDNRLD